jgi:osmotically-inducible protein OsmY
MKPSFRTHRVSSSIVGFSTLMLLNGCASPPEERLETAAHNVREAREAVGEQNEELVDKHDEVREAEEELGEARERLTEAQQRLQRARQQLDTQATDVALFRSIQRSLLDDSALTDAAVSVQVVNRVVTLQGTLTEPGQRDRAIAIATSSPGVAQVKEALRVKDDEDAATREKRERVARAQGGTGGSRVCGARRNQGSLELAPDRPHRRAR